MKSSKTIWLTFGAVIIGFVLIGYIFFTQLTQKEGQLENQIEGHQDCGQDCIPAELKQDVVESQVIASSIDQPQQMVATKKPARQEHTAMANGDVKLGLSNKKLTQQQTAKKTYDDNWCSARHELNESDYLFAKNEYDDWLITIGKAQAGNPRTSPLDESIYDNSNLIESYESLPLEQLQTLALQGDKWAMVTFIQHRSASDEAKHKIAKKLMVNGAFYFALEYLVLNALVEAKQTARKRDIETTTEYVTDALTYAYWGLQYYDIGGIESFYSVGLSERNRELMPIDTILINSVDKVNEKLAKLNQWVNEQRAAQGIVMPTPPSSVPKSFQLAVAASEISSPKALELLRSLDITNSNRIASTPCVESHLAAIKKAREEF